jgi:hypothetical protein
MSTIPRPWTGRCGRRSPILLELLFAGASPEHRCADTSGSDAVIREAAHTRCQCRAFIGLGFEETLMRTKYPLLIIVAAIVFSPGVFPVPGFSQAVFYQGKVLKIINNDPGGVVSLRVKTVAKYLSKYIPGNPTIIVEIIDGGGGRRAANHVFQNAKPDGLTIGALSGSVVGLQVMRETGVMYDIDKFIHLGTPISEKHNVIYTRSVLGLNSLEKLRAASGVKLGAQEVGGASRRGCLPTFSI